MDEHGNSPASMPAVNTAERLARSNTAESGGNPNRVASARSYGATFATEFFVMAAQVLLYKFAAAWLGQTGFSEYALARRVLAFLQPITMLGLGVGLPRYIGVAEGRGESARSSQYLYATLLCVGSFTAVLALVFLIWPHWFSYVFFGSAGDQHLLSGMVLMLVGMASNSILYAFLRGKLAVGRANLLQVLNNGLVPVVIFALFHHDVASLLRYLGLAWIATTGIMFLITPIKFSSHNPLPEVRDLLRYGPQRLPGDFALNGIMALPAIFAAHISGIQQAGYVAFGLAMVNMVASVFSPIGIILLPKVSRAVGSGDFDEMGREIVLIRRLTLLLGGAMVVMVEILGGPLIRLYLGPEYTPATAMVKVLMLGALPLAFFSALRSAVDACHHRAINTLNLIPAFILFVAGSGIGILLRNSQSVLWSFSAALVLLALLTQREVHKILTLPRAIAPPAAIAVAESPESLA
jgi:O-antigen/teichoic acid export membrane protein